MKIDEVKEQLQEDLLCILDGTSQETLDSVCQAVVDNLNRVSTTAQQEASRGT